MGRTLDERHQTVTDSNEGASRRAVLLGAGAAGVAGLLAACGSGDTPGPTAPTSTTPPATTNPSPSPSPSLNPNAAASPSAAGEDPNAIKAADIPVGGGAIYPDKRVVVTQPTAGTFKAFDATCTHQGCLVTQVSGGTINCACHGSEYKVADGAVVRGPATRALPPKTATLNGATITVS
jgi:Rieske Fe-S protein